jgi:hypothetical protein
MKAIGFVLAARLLAMGVPATQAVDGLLHIAAPDGS